MKFLRQLWILDRKVVLGDEALLNRLVSLRFALVILPLAALLIYKASKSHWLIESDTRTETLVSFCLLLSLYLMLFSVRLVWNVNGARRLVRG